MVGKLDDCLERLRRHNSDTAPPAPEAIALAEEAEFQQFQARQREEEERRCPSLRSIPRFYERRLAPHDDSSSLREDVLRLARMQLLHRKSSEELLDEEDLHGISALLKERAREWVSSGRKDVEVIHYDGFASIREELVKKGERFRKFFTPSIFLKFPRDENGRIAILTFFTYIVRKVHINQSRVELSYYDEKRGGYLREKDLENFIFELIPRLPQLNTLQEEFYPFYVFTAVRKFFFFLDPKRTGRIRIRDLLPSQILIELYELRQEHPLGAQEAASNWFSMQSALKVYSEYLTLDEDQNGMLSKKELSHHGNGMLTDVFIERVFDAIQTYKDAETGEQEMDYKAFLDFVLAMENKKTKQAVQYFWKLIDINHKGWLDGFVINYFFRAVTVVLRNQRGVDVPSVDDVKDEIFDMVKSKVPGIITLEDLINCRQGGLVLSMMVDAHVFWRYDNRESLGYGSDDEDLDL